jgi:hypothetical protein
MKKYLIFNFLLFVSVFSYSQSQDLDFISRLQGIKQDGIDFFELEGYQIYVKIINQSFDEKGIKKAKRELKIKKSLIGYKSTEFQFKNLIINQNDFENEKLKNYQSWYLFEKTQNQIICFWFGSLNKKDTILEHKFIKTFLDNKIPQSIYSPMQVDSIDFAGRKIALGESCHWMGVHNVQCPYYGQMNWSLHSTYQDAENMTNSQYLSTEQRKIGVILESKEIDVIFEGSDTKAKRVVYKIKLPSLIIGGSNILIIYYVTTKIRNNYISCVLSHYSNDVNNNGLSPLISKVMKLK